MTDSLIPDGCKCLSYGHGLTMTRVTVSYCPLHGTNPTLRDKEALAAAKAGN